MSTLSERVALATPRDTDGGPFRVDSDAVRALAAGIDPARIASSWPAIGELRIHAGRVLREVTFLATDVSPDMEGMVHLNGITDGHRENTAPALLARIAGTPHRAVTYLLPDDLEVSYRLVLDVDIPVDAGRTREGWLRIHRLGRPDSANPERIPNPLGSESSVLRMPHARRHPAWDGESSSETAWEHIRIPTGRRALDVWRPPSSEGLLLLLDGEHWTGLGVAAALDRRGGVPRTVVAIPSGTTLERAQLLPDPERIAHAIESDVLVALAAAGELHPSESTIVAGQSYGGLAAAGLAATRPDLVGAAIVQSGSFHFRAGGAPHAPAGQRGDLLDALGDARVQGRHLIQVGSEEGAMVAGARAFHEIATRGGARADIAIYPGGHDYAWWRTGLFDALDRLDAETVGGIHSADVTE